MLHRLFYLSWAWIWIDWVLKLLLYFLFFFFYSRSFERQGKGNQLLAVKACCQNRDAPPNNNNNHNHRCSPKTVEPLLFQFCTPKHSYTESTHTHTTSTVKMSILTQLRLRSKRWRHSCQVVFLTSGPFLVCRVSLFSYCRVYSIQMLYFIWKTLDLYESHKLTRIYAYMYAANLQKREKDLKWPASLQPENQRFMTVCFKKPRSFVTVTCENDKLSKGHAKRWRINDCISVTAPSAWLEN